MPPHPEGPRMDETTGVAQTPRDTPALLAFEVGEVEYALPIRGVLTVIPSRPATPIPGRDAAVTGVLPLRGRMVTLVEARRRLGLPDRTGPRAHVIVLERGGDLLGLVVDAVSRVCVTGPRVLDPEALLGGLP